MSTKQTTTTTTTTLPAGGAEQAAVQTGISGGAGGGVDGMHAYHTGMADMANVTAAKLALDKQLSGQNQQQQSQPQQQQPMQTQQQQQPQQVIVQDRDHVPGAPSLFGAKRHHGHKHQPDTVVIQQPAANAAVVPNATQTTVIRPQ
jgi:hypothetical protein